MAPIPFTPPDVIEEFERLLADAVRYHTPSSTFPDFGARVRVVNRLDLRAFVKVARVKRTPEDVAKALFMAIDFKLEVFTVLVVDWDLYDRIVLSLSPRDTACLVPGQNECQRIYAYSMDQGLIGKVRITIERLMNMIHFVETGRELGFTTSKRKKFEKWLATRPDLADLGEILNATANFDTDLRTPEYHSGSILRKLMLAGDLSLSSTIMERFVGMVNGIVTTVVPRYFSAHISNVNGIGAD